MEQNKFLAMMPYIVSDLVQMISKEKRITEKDAINKLYTSKLYAALEQEDLKVWQYSTPMLYSMFKEEEENGDFKYPDI